MMVMVRNKTIIGLKCHEQTHKYKNKVLEIRL